MVIDGGIIENAITGIKVFRDDAHFPFSGAGYIGSGGSILECNNGSFVNNMIGIAFAPYAPANLSFIANSSFDVNEDYPMSEPFYGHVLFDEVNSIKIGGCTFSNSLNVSGTSIEERGYGVKSNNSTFYVRGACSDPFSGCDQVNRNNFINLGYGVYSAVTVSKNSSAYEVVQSDFENCFVGVRNAGSVGGTIIQNTFNVGNVPLGINANNMFGICFEGSTEGWICEENTFANNGFALSIQTIGILCDGTYESNKDIRRNTFIFLDEANRAQELNAGFSGDDGVLYTCNINSFSNSFDLHITEGGVIRNRQAHEVGNPPFIDYRSTHNLFSTNSGNSNIDNEGTQFYYHFWDQNPFEIPQLT